MANAGIKNIISHSQVKMFILVAPIQTMV